MGFKVFDSVYDSTGVMTSFSMWDRECVGGKRLEDFVFEGALFFEGASREGVQTLHKAFCWPVLKQKRTQNVFYFNRALRQAPSRAGSLPVGPGKSVEVVSEGTL